MTPTASSKATPGPWTAHPRCHIIRLSGQAITCFEVGSEAASGWIALVQEEPQSGQSGLANARLIAAAWELYEALKLVDEFHTEPLSVIDPTSDGQKMLASVRAVLAKVEKAPEGRAG